MVAYGDLNETLIPPRLVNCNNKYLLSNNLRFVVGLGFERTVIRPKVDTIRYTSNPALVNLIR